MTLLETSCIGMNDQEPAAIINGVIFTSLNEEKVKKIAGQMRKNIDVQEMVEEYGDGANQHDLVRAMVKTISGEKDR